MRQIPPTPENIRAALRHVSPSCERGMWVRILAAIKDALGEDGRAIADAWSQEGDSYQKTDFRDAWKSIKGSGKVTVATLWRMAIDAGWKPDSEAREETEAERQARERQKAARAEKEAREKARKAKQAATKVTALWKAASPAQADHGYLSRKGINPVPALREIPVEQATALLEYAPKSDGEPLAGRVLVVPVKIDGKLTTAELIDETGRKCAVAGGPKSGGLWAAQPLPKGDGGGLVLAVGEGVATVLTCREAGGYPVIASLTASNLPKVAKLLKDLYPAARLLILGDVGGGLKYAEQAARIKGAALAVPVFSPEQVAAYQGDHGKPPTDFNDLAALAGLDAVRAQLAAALAELPQDQPPAMDGNTAAPSETAKPDGTGGTDGTATDGAASGDIPRQPSGGGGNADDEPARPSYVVREEWSQYGPPGVWFHGYRSAGKGKDPEPLDLRVCSPLHVEAVTCTDDDRNFGRLLRFQDTFKRWRTWAMPMEMLRGSCEEVRGELLSAGVLIDYQERARLAEYLQWRIPKKRIIAAIRTGWTRDGAAFVLPEEVIGSADVYYQSESMHSEGAAERRGDFAAWKSEIAARCVGNPVLALSLCVALAGPLLAKVQRDSGGLHWVGDSSTGKTTALNVGCSVWGSDTFRPAIPLGTPDAPHGLRQIRQGQPTRRPLRPIRIGPARPAGARRGRAGTSGRHRPQGTGRAHGAAVRLSPRILRAGPRQGRKSHRQQAPRQAPRRRLARRTRRASPGRTQGQAPFPAARLRRFPRPRPAVQHLRPARRRRAGTAPRPIRQHGQRALHARQEAGRLGVSTHSPEQAALLAVVARQGLRGLVRAPLDGADCARLQARFEAFLENREQRLRLLIAERTGDADLQAAVLGMVMDGLSSPG